LTIAHLPPSYPNEVASSPIAAPTELASSDIKAIGSAMEVNEEEMDSDYLPSEDKPSDEENSTSKLETEDHLSHCESQEPPLLPSDSTPIVSESSHSTRSKSAKSALEFRPASLSLILSYDDVMSRDCKDLWSSIQFLYSQNKKLFEMYSMQCARLAAAEAHCTLASHQISMLNEQLANKTQKKCWKSKKLLWLNKQSMPRRKRLKPKRLPRKS
jgi:hypothetical protein